MRLRGAGVATAVVAGIGLLASGVGGLAQLDARLAADDRERDAIRQERPVATHHDCPWRDDRRS